MTGLIHAGEVFWSSLVMAGLQLRHRNLIGRVSIHPSGRCCSILVHKPTLGDSCTILRIGTGPVTHAHVQQAPNMKLVFWGPPWGGNRRAILAAGKEDRPDCLRPPYLLLPAHMDDPRDREECLPVSQP